jgi:hypothetical protein
VQRASRISVGGAPQNFLRLLLAITLIDRQYLPFWEIYQELIFSGVFASFALNLGLRKLNGSCKYPAEPL